jgi:hypothetical protein
MSTLRPPAASFFDHNHADPWARAFVDLPTLNARVSNAIVETINGVRAAARDPNAELRTASLLVLGPAGAGKTHLFARLRRKLGPRAIFVHLRPLVGTEMTPRYVLNEIVKQLAYETATPDGAPFRQLDTLVGASLAHLRGESLNMPRVFLDSCVDLGEEKRREMLEAAIEQLIERHPEVDEAYLARLLEAPFMKPSNQRAALAWLAGRDLEESQLVRLGVPSGLAEERIIGALQTLGVFAAPGAPIVLVFDQLENLADPEGAGNRVRAYANLVAELFDAMRGFVIVQMALDTEWEQAIVPELSQAQKTRLAVRLELIALPKAEEARELVRLWVDQLPAQPEPFPWPFGERRVKKWCETVGMTPRMLMIACRQALAEGPVEEEPEADAPRDDTAPDFEPIDEASIADGLAAAWDQHLAAARAALDEAAADRRSADAARLVGGVACALRFVPGVKVSRIDARQTVQIDATANDKPASLCFLHQTHPRAVTSALLKVAEAKKKAKGEVLLIRERVLEFPPTWKAVQGRQATLQREGVRWITLERDDAARLLALESFIAAARSRDLEDARGRLVGEPHVLGWLERTLDVASWLIMRAFTGGHEAAPAAESGLDVALTPAMGVPAVGDTEATIRACLASLRIASLDRIVREVARARPDTTRAQVVDALKTMDVYWYGRAIVGVSKEQRP